MRYATSRDDRHVIARMWCPACEVGSLEAACWVCGHPMMLHGRWLAIRQRR